MAGVEQLIKDLKKLSEDQETADICFLVGEENPERITAHKLILSARCKSFRGVPGTIVKMPNVTPATFRQMINYVYTGRAVLHDDLKLMTLAHDLGIEDLKAACEDNIISNLNVENACKFLLLAMESGHIVGFDEYMNLVLDDAEEYNTKSKNRKTMGRIMLKGDNITLIQNVNPTLS